MRKWIDLLEELFIDEDFSDLGRLPIEKSYKGQPLSPSEDSFKRVTPRVFYVAIRRIAENDIIKMNKGLPSKGLHTLHVYKLEEYKNMKCFLGVNNSSGFAIKGSELVSVFSTGGSSGNAIMVAAIANGATKLDCFAHRDENGKISGPLYRLYSRYGFHIDTDLNVGVPGEAYSIVHGVSDYVDDSETVRPEDPRVVIFMKR